jgi:hypothetical protein
MLFLYLRCNITTKLQLTVAWESANVELLTAEAKRSMARHNNSRNYRRIGVDAGGHCFLTWCEWQSEDIVKTRVKHAARETTGRQVFNPEYERSVSETLSSTYQPTQCYNPEDQHRHLHRRENLTSQQVLKTIINFLGIIHSTKFNR